MADPSMDPSPSRGGLLREPTLHFVLGAALLFALNAGLRSRSRASVIEVDRREIEASILQIESSIGVELTPEERQRVEDAHVEQEVLVREALALGLDDDPRIREILAQKMLHVLSADVIQPTAEELAAFYRDHRDRYTLPEAVTFDELVIGTTDTLPTVLRAQLETGRAPDRLTSDLRMQASVLQEVTLEDLVRLFGPETAQRVFDGAEGAWVGPRPSVRGQHWFRVTERRATALQPLDDIREQVRLDWIDTEEQARLDQRVQELRSRYLVEYVGEGSTR